MATGQIILIVILSIIVGVPVYAGLGSTVAKAIIVFLFGCAEWLSGKQFRDKASEVFNDYPWWVAALWPVGIFAAALYFTVGLIAGWIRLIKFFLTV